MKLIKFICRLFRSLFSEGKDSLSIRKILGAIGFGVCIYAIFHPGIDANQFDSLLYMSSALLGSTTFDVVINRETKGVKEE
jgi:hypothetical protein